MGTAVIPFSLSTFFVLLRAGLGIALILIFLPLVLVVGNTVCSVPFRRMVSLE